MNHAGYCITILRLACNDQEVGQVNYGHLLLFELTHLPLLFLSERESGQQVPPAFVGRSQRIEEADLDTESGLSQKTRQLPPDRWVSSGASQRRHPDVARNALLGPFHHPSKIRFKQNEGTVRIENPMGLIQGRAKTIHPHQHILHEDEVELPIPKRKPRDIAADTMRGHDRTQRRGRPVESKGFAAAASAQLRQS